MWAQILSRDLAMLPSTSVQGLSQSPRVQVESRVMSGGPGHEGGALWASVMQKELIPELTAHLELPGTYLCPCTGSHS